MRFNRLNQKVIKWAKDKGIFVKATPYTQHSKTLEEVQELSDALTAQEAGESEFIDNDGNLKNTEFEIKDAIGDILVTLIIQCEMQGITIEESLLSAYNVISKRTGKMVDGVFVKDK